MLLCEGVASVGVLLQPMLHRDEATLRVGVSVTGVSLPPSPRVTLANEVGEVNTTLTYNPSQTLLKRNSLMSHLLRING